MGIGLNHEGYKQKCMWVLGSDYQERKLALHLPFFISVGRKVDMMAGTQAATLDCEVETVC